MHVSVDADRCEGHARCWGICPEVFDLNAEGHAVVKLADVPEDVEERARDAARNCPERAIELS